MLKEKVASIRSNKVETLTDLGGQTSLCPMNQCKCSSKQKRDYVYIPGNYVLLISLPISEEFG